MADISPDDLRAAVAAGRVDEATAAGLAAFAAERQGLRAALAKEDEPFEFFRGFGEIFISVGLALLFGALLAFALMRAAGGDADTLVAIPGVALFLAWVFSVYFALRRRMALPSILLAVMFATSLAALLNSFASGILASVVGPAEMTPRLEGLRLMGVAAFGLIGMAIYYRVFRLPFALAPLGVFGGILAIATAEAISPSMHGNLSRGSLDLAQAPAFALAILLFGLAAFAVAMRFDLKDPHRLGRHSASAFWLHILAAPAIVNTVCLTLYNLGGLVGYCAAGLAFLAVAAMALAIDRRSFLMAGVVYAGLSIGAAFEAAGGDDEFSGIATVFLLGVGITWLGAHWAGARARLMRWLPDFPLKDRLPPY